jgi:hypothetical protein
VGGPYVHGQEARSVEEQLHKQFACLGSVRHRNRASTSTTTTATTTQPSTSTVVAAAAATVAGNTSNHNSNNNTSARALQCAARLHGLLQFTAVSEDPYLLAAINVGVSGIGCVVVVALVATNTHTHHFDAMHGSSVRAPHAARPHCTHLCCPSFSDAAELAALSSHQPLPTPPAPPRLTVFSVFLLSFAFIHARCSLCVFSLFLCPLSCRLSSRSRSLPFAVSPVSLSLPSSQHH